MGARRFRTLSGTVPGRVQSRLRGLMLDGYVQHWSCACRSEGRVLAAEYYLQPDAPDLLLPWRS